MSFKTASSSASGSCSTMQYYDGLKPSTAASFTLHLDTLTFVAGDVLSGYVTLDIAQAQLDRLASLRIELRGVSSLSIIPSSIGQTPRTSARTLLKLVHPLWMPTSTSTSSRRTSESHTINLPFHFSLSNDLPPSFSESCRADSSSTATGLSAKIQYRLIVKAERQGLLRRAHKTEHIVAIVASSDGQASHLKSLPSSTPWVGPWRTLSSQLLLPQGCGSADIELDLPDVREYPIESPVPFHCRVTIRSSLSSSSSSPPSHGHIILSRRFAVDAGSFEKAHATSRTPSGSISNFQCSTEPRDNDCGYIYHSSGRLTLSGTPSFHTPQNDIRVSHHLHLELSMSGLDKPLITSWDLSLCAGIESPPPSFDIASTTPPLYNDLPLPSYES